ncbi:putative signal peptide protein [Puccinia sorghi]|uniref:Putative signal peptide protein n=1 Tax=Puccinia sorghi TaxID=27349 RepID=A0A0L6USD0_9BASI|nr:putative signal peptide protein [Puccinia sorghi]
MQFTVFVAALAVCTGVFASPVSEHVQAQLIGQAHQATQAGQAKQFGPFFGGYPYGYTPYGYNSYYGGYYGW